ncbi:unnamed protein product [Scytosiphon promiscuus]
MGLDHRGYAVRGLPEGLRDICRSRRQQNGPGEIFRQQRHVPNFAGMSIWAWERAKVSLKSVSHDCRIDLSELSDELLDVDMEGMDYARNCKNAEGEELVAGYGTWDLVLRPALLRKFFKPPCDSIARAVYEQLEAPHLQGLTSVVMVGGFSGSVHEAVKACVLSKYPDNSVNVAVASSPDLAIVQGAGHYVALHQKPRAVIGGRYPAASGAAKPTAPSPPYDSVPLFNSITCPNSYGILAADAVGGEILFDPFLLMGENYALDHVVRKDYNVLRFDQPIVIAITSCNSHAVRPGANRLCDIGGSENLRSIKLPVTSPSPPMSVTCCGLTKRSKSAENIKIFVEFRLNGIELHVRVKGWNGKRLLTQTVSFAGGGGTPQ